MDKHYKRPTEVFYPHDDKKKTNGAFSIERPNLKLNQYQLDNGLDSNGRPLFQYDHGKKDDSNNHHTNSKTKPNDTPNPNSNGSGGKDKIPFNQAMNDKSVVHHRRVVNCCMAVFAVIVILAGAGGIASYGAIKNQHAKTVQMEQKAHKKPKVVYKTKVKYHKAKPKSNPNQAAINKEADQRAVDAANKEAYENAQKATDEKVKEANERFNSKLDSLKDRDQNTLQKDGKEAQHASTKGSNDSDASKVGSNSSSNDNSNNGSAKSASQQADSSDRANVQSQGND